MQVAPTEFRLLHWADAVKRAVALKDNLQNESQRLAYAHVCNRLTKIFYSMFPGTTNGYPLTTALFEEHLDVSHDTTAFAAVLDYLNEPLFNVLIHSTHLLLNDIEESL